MGYPSIDCDNSHRQNKAFKQRLKYRLDQGYSPEEAFQLASVKLRIVPKAQSSERTDENYPQNADQNKGDFRRPENQNSSDENSSDKQNPCTSSFSYQPTDEEVRREIDRLKAEGRMTEILAQANTTGVAERLAQKSPALVTPASAPSKKIGQALDGLSALACVWLVLSMTIALPGAWYWTLPIAVAIEFTPMLVFRSKIDVESRICTDLGAVAIFILGLALYLAPSAQIVWNEAQDYRAARANYAQDLAQFEQQSKNAQDLLDRAKARSDGSEKAFHEAEQSFGTASWRTASSKKLYDRDFQDWKDRSNERNNLKAPMPPKINGELTEAAQTVATRLVLFGSMFLLMFVKRKLQAD